MGSFAENDLQFTATYGSAPPCTIRDEPVPTNRYEKASRSCLVLCVSIYLLLLFNTCS